MSSAPSLSHAATAKAAEAALPAPVSSSSPSITNSMPWRGALQEFLMTEVDPDLSTIPLAAYCFMTGWMFVSFPSPFAIADLALLVMWCPSPPYSFGVHSKLATRCRCVMFSLLALRLSSPLAKSFSWRSLLLASSRALQATTILPFISQTSKLSLP